MTPFPSHDLDSAPDAAKPMLQTAQARFGFIPDIYAKMANAPAALEGYLALLECFDHTSFTAQEQQVIQLAISIENRCEYCVSAHSMIAKQMAQVAPEVVDALRQQSPAPDPRLQALIEFARTVVRERGFVPQAAIDKFLAAGFAQQQVLEVVLGVAIKTLSNYSNHITQPQVDTAFEAHRWQTDPKPM